MTLIVSGSASATVSNTIEAETMSLADSGVQVNSSADGSGGKDVAFSGMGSASKTFAGAATEVTLRAREALTAAATRGSRCTWTAGSGEP